MAHVIKMSTHKYGHWQIKNKGDIIIMSGHANQQACFKKKFFTLNEKHQMHNIEYFVTRKGQSYIYQTFSIQVNSTDNSQN